MKKYAVMVMFLVAMFFSSVAFAGTGTYSYSVRAGDTLSGIAKKRGESLADLKSLNPQIKNFNKIWPGQVINTPSDKLSTTHIKLVVSKTVLQKTARPWNPGSNPWCLSKAEGVRRLHFSPSGERDFLNALSSKHFSIARIYKNGQVFDDFGNEYRMLKMGFGKGSFFQPIPAWKDELHAEAGWMYKSGNEYLVFPFKCGNPTSLELVKATEVKTKSVQKLAPTTPKSQPEKKSELPSIFKEVPVEKQCVTSEHELDAGGGVWRNQDSSSKGDWWFLQYKWYLRSCQNETKAFGGTLTPVIGAFAKGDRGSTDAGYDWNNWGVGPQVGFMWDSATDKGYPQQIQFMLRAIYFHMHGQNGWSGYSKEQEHILVGYYIEYLRRFHPKYMTILYSEGWFDVNKNFNSTWSGDKVNDMTQFVIGAKLHRDLTDSWAVRLGPQFGYQIDENRLGATFVAELRYDDWLIFGPSFDYCISSNAINEAGGWAAGVFARVELHKQITKKYTEYRMQKVTTSDKQLLKY